MTRIGIGGTFKTPRTVMVCDSCYEDVEDVPDPPDTVEEVETPIEPQEKPVSYRSSGPGQDDWSGW